MQGTFDILENIVEKSDKEAGGIVVQGEIILIFLVKYLIKG